jgi:hypothetical protein
LAGSPIPLALAVSANDEMSAMLQARRRSICVMGACRK